jgi:hypothetical protein
MQIQISIRTPGFNPSKMNKMKYSFSTYISTFVLVFMVWGCNEDPELSVLQTVSFSGPITVTPDQVTIHEADSTTALVHIQWPAVDYFRDVPVTYSIQLTTTDDVATWAKAYEVAVGVNVLTTSLTGNQLNKIALDNLGLIPDAESEIAIRVKSYVDRAAYSEPAYLKVTPYKLISHYPSLWVAGDFQGWNISTARTIVSVHDDGIYEGYIFIPAGGTNEFKLYAQPDWGPVSYGTDNDGIIYEANFAGANFKAPTDGYYLLDVNLNNMTYLLIKTEWGIIGSATPGGWTTDTPLTYDEVSQTWSTTAHLITAGSFKFRANQAWQLDFGIDTEGKLTYANHPWKVYVDQPQLSVAEDGNYFISLDLHEPGNYTYQLIKN